MDDKLTELIKTPILQFLEMKVNLFLYSMEVYSILNSILNGVNII